MRPFNKIFGIGLSRTGTNSLAQALAVLSIRTVHWPLDMASICQHQAATDLTVTCRFEALDLMFPGSLFIYTQRELDSWLVSVALHYTRMLKDNARLYPANFSSRIFAQEADFLVYGSLNPSEGHFRAAYSRHHEKVCRWFAGRDDHLLPLNIIEEGSWQNLCDFLDLPIPAQPFPWLNRQSTNKPLGSA